MNFKGVVMIDEDNLKKFFEVLAIAEDASSSIITECFRIASIIGEKLPSFGRLSSSPEIESFNRR